MEQKAAVKPLQADAEIGEQASSTSLANNSPGVLRVIGAIAGQTTLVTALLFYFGWARTQAAFSYFGLDSALAQFSVSDYILRSVDVTVRPLVILGLVALLFLWGHQYLMQSLAAHWGTRRARMTALSFILSGFLLCVLGILGFYNWIVYSTAYPFVPILLAIGITLIGYGLNLRGLTRSGARGEPGHNRPQWALVIVLDIVLIFWTVSVYAGVSGQKAAETLASSLGGLPSVVVYSENSLAITAPGTTVERLPGSGNKYRYRYSNLRLLLYSSGEYFLLPDGWKQGLGHALLLKADDTVRFEFYRG